MTGGGRERSLRIHGAAPPGSARRKDAAERVESKADLRALLDSARGELEAAILQRVQAIGGAPELVDPTYAEGLSATITVALDYVFEAIRHGEKNVLPPPPALLAQARLAARSGVSLDTVLRRYLAGYTLLGDLLATEAARHDLRDLNLARLIPGRAAILDRLLAAVSEEYLREERTGAESGERRRTERVGRLLAAEPIDASEFDYDFEARHVGLVATGPGVAAAIRTLASCLDRRLLLVKPAEDRAWAWLGGRREFDMEELCRQLATVLPRGACLSFGEPASRLAGWRLTHRQAIAALPIAERGDGASVRYGDAIALAAVLNDELARTSLEAEYLGPLESGRDGGVALIDALTAYFAADRNISSAAAALGASRNTVASRLATAARQLGRSLASCACDLELALKLRQLRDPRQAELSKLPRIP